MSTDSDAAEKFGRFIASAMIVLILTTAVLAGITFHLSCERSFGSAAFGLVLTIIFGWAAVVSTIVVFRRG